MARSSWLDADTNVPTLDAQVSKLDHFTQSMADGVIDANELKKQEEAVAAAMKAVEGELSDEQHVKVTQLLVELSAYNIMATLHELVGERMRQKFGAD